MRNVYTIRRVHTWDLVFELGIDTNPESAGMMECVIATRWWSITVFLTRGK